MATQKTRDDNNVDEEYEKMLAETDKAYNDMLEETNKAYNNMLEELDITPTENKE